MAEARLVARIETDGAQKAKRELDGVASQGKKAETQFNNISKASKTTNERLGNVGRRAGQAGIQIQQFVGQVQGGTNAFVALSQQSADLGFVLGFPLLGAVTGIAAAFAGSLVPSLFESEEATDDLEKSLKALDEVIDVTNGSVSGLSQSVLDLARINEQAARLEIARGLLESTRAIEASSDIIQESVDEILSTFTVGEDQIAALVRRFSESGKDLIEAFPDNADFSTRINFPVLSDALVDLRDEFNITEREAADLLQALGDQIVNRSAESAEALGIVVSELGLKYKLSNSDLLDFSSTISDQTVLIGKNARNYAFLKSVLEDASVAQEEINKKIKESNEIREDSLRRRFRFSQQLDREQDDLEIKRINNEIAREEELIARKEQLQKEFRLREEQAELDFINSQQSVKQADLATTIDQYSSAFGSLADLTGQFAGEQSGVFRALFATQKAFALASSINNIALAQTQAAADGTAITPAQKLANVALITSQLVGVLTTLRGNNFDARQQGGQFRAGQNLLVGEKGPELVQFGSGGRIATNEQTMGMMGGAPNVTIINQTSGRIDEVEVAKNDRGEMILIAREVLNSEVLNPNSDFNKNFDRTRVTERRL